MDNIISHVIPNTRHICKNRKSRRNSNHRCTNLATHGDYCGVHYKKPNPWTPSEKYIMWQQREKAQLYETQNAQNAARIIQIWWKIHYPLRMIHLHGIGYYNRSIITNTEDFFSTDSLQILIGRMLFSYMDQDKHVYAFDIRSIHMLIYKARLACEVPNNPYNRIPFSTSLLHKVERLVHYLKQYSIATEWAPLEPATPEQQWCMKVVDLFRNIDELNYYSSPDWFLDLDLDDHGLFYREIHEIWNHRAGLSIQQKNLIVPRFSVKLFRHPPWALLDQPLETLQRVNMYTIRTLISSAEDRNDRILGAMYVISALTLVSHEARCAYPWLYDSVVHSSVHEIMYENERRYGIQNMISTSLIQELLHHPLHMMPALSLSPTSSSSSSSSSSDN